VVRLHDACNEVLVMAEVQKKLIELGIVAKPESTARFEAIVKEQVGVLGPTVKAAGIKL
jgi:tripartite-type tricarboxylate transporter receptor subunit TctC